MEHISIEWPFSGDANGDARVSVRYRAVGEASWRQGHPLFRVPAGSNAGFSWEQRHVGSLFGLAPDTEYEIELTLSDPDGGGETRTVRSRTRPVPTIPDDAVERTVTPATLPAELRSVRPGTVLMLQAGTYSGFEVRNDGAPDAPIVLRGSSAAEVVVEGDVSLNGRSDVWLMDVTVQGRIRLNDSRRIVVQGCTVRTDRNGIEAYRNGTEDSYIADNRVFGPTRWMRDALGASGANRGEGIVVTGPGNVVAYNYVEGFRDCVSLLEDSEARRQYSIDIVGNDLNQCADDAIEADFAMGNVRVLRNRSRNSFIALSSQPGLGGPTWFVRNVVYGNFFQVFKPNRGSLGDVLYHNTVVKQGDAFGVYTGDTWGRARSRNNIFIGGPEEESANGFSTGSGRIFVARSLDTATADFDYDGFGSVEVGRYEGRFGDIRFASFDEFRSRTSERNAVQLGLDVFAAMVSMPRTLFPPVEAVDLRLRAGSAAVDAGEPIPGINDGFSGSAPDLGAYELGAEPPPYGPRTDGPVCGNTVVEAGEGCDDGNRRDGDGCDARCQVEDTPPGGDGGTPPGDDGGTPPPAGDGGGPGAAGPDTDGGCGCRLQARGTRAAGLAWLLLAFLWLDRRRGGRRDG